MFTVWAVAAILMVQHAKVKTDTTKPVQAVVTAAPAQGAVKKDSVKKHSKKVVKKDTVKAPVVKTDSAKKPTGK